jgi:Phage major capsid protein E
MTAPGGLIYDTNTLIQVVPNLKRAQSFLLDRFFPNIVVSDSEFVSIDVDVGKRRMSPFVSPLVEGKIVEQRRMQTNTYKPPYIKDKRAPDLRKPVRRMIGERIGGAMTGAQREMANLEFEMTDQVDMLTRRLEWMAARVLSTASLVVEGEGFPTALIDFGRDPSLTVAKVSTSKWTPANVVAGNANPTADIETWQSMVLKKSGAKVVDIIFTPSAWRGFIADPLLKGSIIWPRSASAGNVIDPGPRIDTGAVFKGRWGQYDLWLYNDWFVDDSDVEHPMLVDGTILMAGPDLMGTRGFGIILDPDFNYASLAFAPKTWTSKDPGQRYLMMQSSPIIIPSRVNAALSARVCDPVFQ